MESTATAEIDENLERREISADEQAELVARRVETVEAGKQIEAQATPLVTQPAPPTRKDGRRKRPQHEPTGIRQQPAISACPRQGPQHRHCRAPAGDDGARRRPRPLGQQGRAP